LNEHTLVESLATIIDWNNLGTTIGVSAIISGSVSALVNYMIAIKEFKKKTQAEILTQRLTVYAYLQFNANIFYSTFMNVKSCSWAKEQLDSLLQTQRELKSVNERSLHTDRELEKDLDEDAKREFGLDSTRLEKRIHAQKIDIQKTEDEIRQLQEKLRASRKKNG
jgi:hypothetical protein